MSDERCVAKGYTCDACGGKGRVVRHVEGCTARTLVCSKCHGIGVLQRPPFEKLTEGDIMVMRIKIEELKKLMIEELDRIKEILRC